MNRIVAFAYGTLCYAIFLATFLYALAFVGNIGVAQTIDGASQAPLGQALLIDTMLLGLFAVQHSVMARPAFKRWWTRVVPTPVERSTYVLFSSAALLLLFHLWQPMGGIVWDVQEAIGRAVLYSLFGFGWLLVLVTTFISITSICSECVRCGSTCGGKTIHRSDLRLLGYTSTCGIRSTWAGYSPSGPHRR